MPAAAAGFAAAELLAGLLPGGFFGWGRAEALLFLAFRPFLLLALALLLAGRPAPQRAMAYGAALAAAAAAESLLLLALGGAPWAEALRGLLAGALLALGADLLIQLGRRLAGRTGLWAAAAIGLAALFVPGALAPYERLAVGATAPDPQPPRPPLMLMTGLPLVWGEAGPFDASSRPAEAYAALRRDYDVTLLDYLDAGTLAQGRLMLLAQPRALEPAELVALDAWVRAGGRALILADPLLAWPSELPLGDMRRPPATSLLTPLLGHWGLALDLSDEAAEPRDVATWRGARRLRLQAPGRWRGEGSGCRISADGLLADCRIGAGRALLLADADLLHDATWAAPLPRGGERHLRLSDNLAAIGDWLDALAGTARPAADRPVAWAEAQAPRGLALLLAALPILLLLAAAILLRRAPRG